MKIQKNQKRIAFKQTAADVRNLKQVESIEMDTSEHVTNIRIGTLNARSIKKQGGIHPIIYKGPQIRYNSSHRNVAARHRQRCNLDWIQ